VHQGKPFGNAPRDSENHRHRHVGGVVGADARGIGDQDAALARGGDVDMVDPSTVVRDQLQLVACRGQHFLVDLIGQRRHQNIRALHRLCQRFA
jgi:hypothetical protein